MIASAQQFLRTRWEACARRPSGALLRVFAGRVFHGGGDADASEMNVALGVILILLAMPGLLVSLLLFEKYGSLLRWMRSDGSFDPFVAAIPDEYFFIVLSIVVTGAAAVWRWDALFLDRRDYANIVPLPVSLRRIFFSNLAAIFLLAAVLTLDVNAASVILFPIVVVGSQDSFSLLLRFGAGHAVTMFLSSVFSFFAVFALIGLLLAVLPYSLFRRVSIYLRFLIALFFLALLATGSAVPTFLAQLTHLDKRAVLALPPIWFVGICEALWGNGANPYYAAMASRALIAFAAVLVIAIFSYTVSFRRSFVRIPETTEAGPLPRSQIRLLPVAWFDRLLLRDAPQRACFHFISRTLLRSEAHLQIASAFIALGLVVSAQSLLSALHPGAGASVSAGEFLHSPSEPLLAIPFILAFGIIMGMRLAFEVPASLRSNWVFALWIDAETLRARSIARKILLTFSLVPLIPLCFISSFLLWGLAVALLHTLIFAACVAAFVEVLLLRFRKIPFTCSYPPFQSHSALVFAAYAFAFLIFTSDLPGLDLWALGGLWRPLVFLPLLAIPFAAVHFYRKQMLDMDKRLIFEEPSPSFF